MKNPEIEYLEQRAAMEAEMASRATNRAAVRAHYEMSKAYLETAEALKEKSGQSFR